MPNGVVLSLRLAKKRILLEGPVREPAAAGLFPGELFVEQEDLYVRPRPAGKQ